MIGKIFNSFFIAVLIISLPWVTSCAISKTAYEKRISRVLEDVEKESEPIQKELKTLLSFPAQVKKNKEKIENLDQQQIEILRNAKRRMEKINPPDDFFLGHSDLVEFVELLIEAEESVTINTKKNTQKKKTPKTGMEQTQVFESLSAATQAYSKASRELPFLELELKEAFAEVQNNLQTKAMGVRP